jgi:hypothetical protein
MTPPSTPPSRADREAYRSVLEDALADLPAAPDRERAAAEVMRALDSYMEATGGGTALSPREAPVTNYERDRREVDNVKWPLWIVLGGAVLATIVVAIALSGGWPAAIAVVGIWVLALAILVST